MEKTIENEIVTKLFQDGILAEPITTIKNGITCMGIKVVDPENPSIAPIVYYSQDETIEAVVARVLATQNIEAPKIDIDDITNPDYIANHIYMSIQRISDEETDIIKRPCLNLELVLRVSLDLGGSTGSVKVNRALLEKAAIEENAAWQMARDNMMPRFEIKSMAETLGIPEEFAPDIPFYVLTTKDRTNGAVALAPEFRSLFWNFCVHKDVESCWILPSSTEELLLLPCGSIDATPDFLAGMVQEINGTTVVDPLIQLEPVVYRYDTYTDSIIIAASAEIGGVA